jgi:glycine hydroxymethyltransferase
MHVIAAKAVAFKEAMGPDFQVYQEATVKNAAVLAEALQNGGLRLVSNGTDNHMMLADVTEFKLTGKEAEKLLDEVGITVNKNAIPFDPHGPLITSGIRIGTPAVTTRGMQSAEMQLIAAVILQALKEPQNQSALEKCRDQMAELCRAFPIVQAD